MASSTKPATKLLGFRIDKTLLKQFGEIWDRNKSNPSDELRRYIEAVVRDKKLPQTDDELIPVDALDQRIKNATESRFAALESQLAAMANQLGATAPKGEADPVEAIATKGDRKGKLKSVVKGQHPALK